MLFLCPAPETNQPGELLVVHEYVLQFFLQVFEVGQLFALLQHLPDSDALLYVAKLLLDQLIEAFDFDSSFVFLLELHQPEQVVRVELRLKVGWLANDLLHFLDLKVQLLQILGCYLQYLLLDEQKHHLNQQSWTVDLQ